MASMRRTLTIGIASTASFISSSLKISGATKGGHGHIVLDIYTDIRSCCSGIVLDITIYGRSNRRISFLADISFVNGGSIIRLRARRQLNNAAWPCAGFSKKLRPGGARDHSRPCRFPGIQTPGGLSEVLAISYKRKTWFDVGVTFTGGAAAAAGTGMQTQSVRVTCF